MRSPTFALLSAVAVAAAVGGVAAGVVAEPTTEPTTAPTTGPTTAPVAAATTQPDAAIAALVRQLDADDWPTRDAAAARLAERGEAARPALAEAAAHATSPEVRSRAAGVIAQLDRARAELPTRVTLHLDQATPREVLTALSQQAGIPIRPLTDSMLGGVVVGGGAMGGAAANGPVQHVSIDIADQPFWPAMDQVCRKLGLDVRAFGVQDELTVLPGRGDGLLAGPQSASPRAVVLARSYSRYRQVSYTDPAPAPPPSGSDTLTLLALFDPKLRLLRDAPVAVKVTEATDDRGNSLVVPPGAAAAGGAAVAPMVGLNGVRVNVNGINIANQLARSFRGPMSGGPMRELTIDLKTGVVGGTKIATLKGTVTVTVVAKFDRATIDDASNAGRVTRTSAAGTLELESCDVADQQATITVAVRSFVGGPTVLSAAPVLRLEDAAGKPVPTDRPRRTLTNDGQAKYTVKATADGPIRTPVRLVWETVARTEPFTAPFEFHDLPLPPP